VPVYSERLRAALWLAEEAHRGQLRKGRAVPYVLHPVCVASLLLTAGADEDLVVAGYLHDVVEDSSVTLAEIEERFGPRVAHLVDEVTERKVEDDGTPIPWEVRRRATIEHLAEVDGGVIALKAADVAINLGDVVIDYAEVGDALWQRFNAPAAAQLWYYRRVAEIVVARGTFRLLEDEVRLRLAELEAVMASLGADRPSPPADRPSTSSDRPSTADPPSPARRP
jgi:(p)ppGpp synthase/HD superfamily hydrolase